MRQGAPKKKIAIWHRYGPGDHARCMHSPPYIVEGLARRCEVHYFGMKTQTPVPPLIQANATVHSLPFTFNRKSFRDKLIKTILWYAALPFMALKCRLMGIDLIWIEEPFPLLVPIVRIFFGRKLVITVADFFQDIYLDKISLLRWTRPILDAIDFWAWRRVSIIFTLVKYTAKFLATKGIPEDRVVPIYNPCDRSLYFPADKSAARRRFNLRDNDFVLVHHGILHPNKGNDRIIRALAEIRGDLPNLRFLLIGDGPEMAHLKKLTKDLNMEDVVILTGWLPTEEEVNLGLSSADVGLVMRIGLPSDHFHVTMTLVHEMACGLPILAANLAGIAEIVTDGKDSLLFDTGNMEEFKSKLLRLAGNRLLRETYGRKASDLCGEFFDMDRVVSRVVESLFAALNVTDDISPSS